MKTELSRGSRGLTSVSTQTTYTEPPVFVFYSSFTITSLIGTFKYTRSSPPGWWTGTIRRPALTFGSPLPSPSPPSLTVSVLVTLIVPPVTAKTKQKHPRTRPILRSTGTSTRPFIDVCERSNNLLLSTKVHSTQTEKGGGSLFYGF